MAILVTGGTGYIGSHTCVELMLAGEEVVILDNFSNSKPEVLSKIEKLGEKSAKLYKGDVRDRGVLDKILMKIKSKRLSTLLVLKPWESRL